MNNIEDDFEPMQERVTKIPTSSEVARERALSKIGKDLKWYYQRLAESENEHGEATCAECKKPESKKLPNGRIKMLTVDTKNARLVCTKCSDKMYRQSQKEKVSKRQDRDGVPTLQEFWIRNRNKLDEPEKVQREARHDEVVALTEEIELCNLAFQQNAPFDEAAMRDLIRIVCRDVVDFGVVLTDIAVVDFFKPEHNEFYEHWTSDNVAPAYRKSQKYYVTYGYLAGLPGHVAYPFLQHVEEHFQLPVSLSETYEVRIEHIYDALDGKVYQHPVRYTQCATPGCKQTKVYHFSDPAQWYCITCAEENQKIATAFLSRMRNARLAEIALVNEPQKWMRPFLMRAEKAAREADDRNIPFGEEGPYV